MEWTAMTRFFSLRAMASAAVVAAAVAFTLVSPEGRQLPLEALKDSGQQIYPAFEGWYQNPDGSYNLLLGYYNRNQKQTIDIPVGPNNRVEPGGPDLGQPTHFTPRRGWGVFAIKVPKDFGKDKRFTWTIVANGKPASVPVGLIPDYQIEPFKDMGEGNTPPVLKFTPNGKTFSGPPVETPMTQTPNERGSIAIDPGGGGVVGAVGRTMAGFTGARVSVVPRESCFSLTRRRTH
jgi:hypothetical protein